MKIEWKDNRKPGGVKYVTNSAFADLPERPGGGAKEGYKPTFTILPYDHDGLYSMEKLFLEHYDDPTEFTFVRDVFEGDILHWETVKNGNVLSKYYNMWKKKAEAKLASEAIQRIVSTAFNDTNRNQFSALKYLVERNGKSAVGRPKKEKKVTDDKDDILADIKRLRA